MRRIHAAIAIGLAVCLAGSATAQNSIGPDKPCPAQDVTCGYQSDPAALPLMRGPEDVPARQPSAWAYAAYGGAVALGVLLIAVWVRKRR